MRWIAIAMLLAAGVFPGTARAAEPRYGPCRAQQARDGNTVELRCGEESVRVRLAGVATPKDGEAGCDETRRALHALLRGRELYIAFATPGRPTLDRDGTLLAYLYDGAGQNMNVAMVALGWGAYAASDADPLSARFEAAERVARAEQRALWTIWTYAGD
jgi:endonuclease YncB( thermonuclease family)